MRLLVLEKCDLRSGHLALSTFIGTDIPTYAILSHRWTDDEVLFQDVEQGSSIKRKGYSKLCGAIEQARADGFAFLWDDTCCIDKKSSAELTEAINSMWMWYRDASVCYAYLNDVSSSLEHANFESDFKASAWFTRGWTLQELIAPKRVNFYNKDWVYIGTKEILHLSISEATGIDTDYLNHSRPLSTASAAKRMSWAAHRTTTRPEDMAYCLMGLFSVNMPMLYGEGTRAFQRLQEEILRSSDDESIFAWLDEEAVFEDFHGILADSPWYFKDSGDISPMLDWQNERKPWQTTNMGLNIQRGLTADQMPLLCARRGHPGYLSITVASINNQQVRCHLSTMQCCMHVNPRGNLYFPQRMPHLDPYQRLSETVTCYSLSVSTATTKNSTYIQDSKSIRMHPMIREQTADPHASGIYIVPKEGTYTDLITQFVRPADGQWISVMIGVIGGVELGFAATAGNCSLIDCPSDLNQKIVPDVHRSFKESALPIGSSFDVGGLHRVAVKRISSRRDMPFVINGIAFTEDQMELLEIDISALVGKSPLYSQDMFLNMEQFRGAFWQFRGLSRLVTNLQTAFRD